MCSTSALNTLKPIGATAVILFIYVTFFCANLLPQLQRLRFGRDPPPIVETDPHVHAATQTEIVLVASSFHLLFLLFVVSWLRASCTKPGAVPHTDFWKQGRFRNLYDSAAAADQDEQRLQQLISQATANSQRKFTDDEKKFLQQMPVVERKQETAKERACSKCHYFKPDRTHHCSQCQVCVLKMDHHCPWVANCIGFHNYKYFVLTVFYATVCAFFIDFAMLPRLIHVFRPILDTRQFLLFDLPIAIAWALAALIGTGLAYFLSFHLYLTFNGMTTIEYHEQMRSKQPALRARFAVCRVKFDRGRYGNWKAVMGEWYECLLPVEAFDELENGLFLGPRGFSYPSSSSPSGTKSGASAATTNGITNAVGAAAAGGGGGETKRSTAAASSNHAADESGEETAVDEDGGDEGEEQHDEELGIDSADPEAQEIDEEAGHAVPATAAATGGGGAVTTNGRAAAAGMHAEDSGVGLGGSAHDPNRARLVGGSSRSHLHHRVVLVDHERRPLLGGS